MRPDRGLFAVGLTAAFCVACGNDAITDPDLAASLTAVTVGTVHVCGLTSGGEAYCWGWNRDGQLGDSTTTSRAVPVRVTGGKTFAALAAGGAHTCGLTDDGTAWCWGFN